MQCKSVVMMNSKIGRQPRGISEPKLHEDQNPCIRQPQSDRGESVMPAITPKPENLTPLIFVVRAEKACLH
jgi:hypothetical protein